MKIKLLNLSLIFIILSLSHTAHTHASLHSHNTTDDHKLSLHERLEIQKSTVHWYPYQKIFYLVDNEGALVELATCPKRPPAIEEFPDGFWTRQQRLYGLFLIHILAAIYCFIVIAFICDKYFLPTIERICTVLDISQDVAATTFMATATTIPEFFTNTISTFIAESDMGLSAIIGSMLFNTLGVAACASLFIKKPIQIDWWPITRDSTLLCVHLSVLITFAWDGAIMWYESVILVSMLVFYWILMFQNKKLVRGVKYVVEERLLWCQRIKNYDIANQRPKTEAEINGTEVEVAKPSGIDNPVFVVSKASIDYSSTQGKRRQSTDLAEIYGEVNHPAVHKGRRLSTDLAEIYAEPEEEEFTLWEIPKNVTLFEKCWYFFTWPVRFLLHYTIPDPMKHKKLYPLSFIMCIVWIAGMSWIVFWMVVILGDTFRIPDPIMGMTFLAFGGCMPEAISAVIVARKGSGQMGVSNALGANCLAVVFSLGFPWFIRTMVDGIVVGWDNSYIRIYSYGVEFTLIAIIFAVCLLYAVIAAAGYKLRKTVGAILFVLYLGFAAFAILVELDILFPRSC
ncbi:sodium/potassium/calcium exchanger 5-like [Chironomus tepperi]|uniref:sodium/potassium/calcium exchanger 5-like n=1 Tax=Chironomus tepperi TaxID=113505 RepID=UPI00391F7868